MIEGGGVAESKNEGPWNGRELKSLWISDGLNGNCSEAQSTNHRPLFNCPTVSCVCEKCMRAKGSMHSHWLEVV